MSNSQCAQPEQRPQFWCAAMIDCEGTPFHFSRVQKRREVAEAARDAWAKDVGADRVAALPVFIGAPAIPAPEGALAGMEIVIDDTIPPDEMHVVQDGKVTQVVKVGMPEAAPAQAPAEGDEPLFLLHCGQIDSSGEQDEWETQADSYKRVEEFCRQHPGQTVKLYPHVQPKGTGPTECASQADLRSLLIDGAHWCRIDDHDEWAALMEKAAEALAPLNIANPYAHSKNHASVWQAGFDAGRRAAIQAPAPAPEMPTGQAELHALLTDGAYWCRVDAHEEWAALMERASRALAPVPTANPYAHSKNHASVWQAGFDAGRRAVQAPAVKAEMPWLVFNIGCIECGVSSNVVGRYATEEEAKRVADACDKALSWREGGQNAFEVFDLRAPQADEYRAAIDGFDVPVQHKEGA